MPTIINLEHANDGVKKYKATFDDGTITKFGQFGANDFTLTGDVNARRLYRARHKKDLKTNYPRRAGNLSYFILWNLPTVKESVREFNQLFG